MAKLRGCRTCLVELEEIALANGSVVLFCATCDAMADLGHHAGGRRPWAAGMARQPLKLVVNRPKKPNTTSAATSRSRATAG
jgi:hypothetical protein